MYNIRIYSRMKMRGRRLHFSIVLNCVLPTRGERMHHFWREIEKERNKTHVNYYYYSMFRLRLTNFGLCPARHEVH